MTERFPLLIRAKLLGSEVYGWVYTLETAEGKAYKAIRRDSSTSTFSSPREAEAWLKECAREGGRGNDA